ncbi:unnamed protein product [Didymodactylos carnosus]|uniref:Uncharacterized protein n=1 Tax=Didymodactylos carnosus TaxID=1234261 RepID=A0A815K9J6_9BILA|nr:unnamed protein product [Didymodactylos carnosus]CAF4287105.1 unnamed protein product [Didymodactylos carnosus]
MASSSFTTSSSSSYNEMNIDEFYTIYHGECQGNVEQAQERIFEFFGLASTEKNTNFIQAKIKYFTTKKKDKFDDWRKIHSLAHHKEKFLGPAILKGEFPVNEPVPSDKPKPPKRPTQDFTQVGTRQKRRKLADLNTELDEFARDNSIEVNQVIGYLLHQRNYLTNKHLAKLGDELFKTGTISEDARTNLDVDHALALKIHINMSRNDVDFIKSCLNEGIHIPNRNLIREHSQTLLPVIKKCREERGRMVENVGDSIILTAKRLIDQLLKQNIPLSTDLIYRQKTGHDGAGGQGLYRSNRNPMTDANISSKMVISLSLSDCTTGQVFWRNQSPNSAFWARPMALIAEKESPDLIRFINEVFEPQEKVLRENGLVFDHIGQSFKISIISEDSMKDLKVRMVESGLGGAKCFMCYTRQADWKDVRKIEEDNYFAITRPAERTEQLYKEMVEEKGEIIRRRNDYEIRGGLTTEPLSSSDHHFLTLTHQYINGTAWFLRIFYHIVADILVWTVRGAEGQQKIKEAKQVLLRHIEDKTGLRLDQVDCSGGNTGTSTTGGQGRRFFSHDLRGENYRCNTQEV